MEAIPYKFDPPFRAAARKKQSDFRKEVLKVAFDPNDRLAKYGNLLRAEDAKCGLNFYEGYRECILKRDWTIQKTTIRQSATFGAYSLECVFSNGNDKRAFGSIRRLVQ